jgi:hypothetical protein
MTVPFPEKEFVSDSTFPNDYYFDHKSNEQHLNADDYIFGQFRQQQEEQFELFKQKHSKYGIDNIQDSETDTDEALQNLLVRITDKFNRLKQMVKTRNYGLDTDETIHDTLDDLSNYANITKIVYNGTWRFDQ